MISKDVTFAPDTPVTDPLGKPIGKVINVDLDTGVVQAVLYEEMKDTIEKFLLKEQTYNFSICKSATE